jgi:hypothetical protein
MKKGKARAGSQAAARTRAKNPDALVTKAVPVEEIQRKAYEIYCLRGGSAGSAIEDWLQAERDLRHDS